MQNLLAMGRRAPAICGSLLRQGRKARISGSQYIGEGFNKYLSHHMVVDPIEIKSTSSEMTGEWVVFHTYEGANYYLAFAFHMETNEEIHKRVVTACEFDNFPFRL